MRGPVGGVVRVEKRHERKTVDGWDLENRFRRGIFIVDKLGKS